MEDQSTFEFEDGEIGQLINQFLSDTVCPHTFIINEMKMKGMNIAERPLQKFIYDTFQGLLLKLRLESLYWKDTF